MKRTLRERRSPASNLDFNAYLPTASAPPGSYFYADDAVIVRS
jgi:hypothetical protein